MRQKGSGDKQGGRQQTRQLMNEITGITHSRASLIFEAVWPWFKRVKGHKNHQQRPDPCWYKHCVNARDPDKAQVIA